MLVINAVPPSKLTVIDSITNTEIPLFGNYSGNNGFKYYDKFSYNLKVIDEDGVGVEDVSIQITDKDGNLIVDVLTDSSGDIEEQYLTRVEGTVTYPDYIYEYPSPYPYGS